MIYDPRTQTVIGPPQKQSAPRDPRAKIARFHLNQEREYREREEAKQRAAAEAQRQAAERAALEINIPDRLTLEAEIRRLAGTVEE
jgi:hypothetical protein